MPFEIVRNTIVDMQVDAIVNTANPMPVIGSGVDDQIHRAAGPELLKAREAIGPIAVGDAFLTPGFRLKARYVIHTCGPVWQGGQQREEAFLYSCYSRSLELAARYGCESIAFPLISSGNYGFPKEKAMQVAVSAIRSFLEKQEMQISLVVYDRESVRLSESRYRDVFRYISGNLGPELPPSPIRESRPDYSMAVQECRAEAPKAARKGLLGSLPVRRPKSRKEEIHTGLYTAAAKPAARPAAPDLSADFLRFEPDAGFSETLLKRIDETGRKDSEIYTRANVSRQHFSKIRNNPGYKPTKPTAIAFAIALELDLEQTKDLIGRAGYALTRSSRFDLIIMYFISQSCYDMYEINAMLFEFDQPLLGA